MSNFIFEKLQEFADQNNLSVSVIREKTIDGITILKFTDEKSKKHANIVLNIYDQLNVNEKEIIKDVTDQVKRRLLKNE